MEYTKNVAWTSRTRRARHGMDVAWTKNSHGLDKILMAWTYFTPICAWPGRISHLAWSSSQV